TFCLLRSTQTCCYGPRPQYNQYILVETKTPVPFERLSPVLVNGVFFVYPKPEEGYIYRMEATSVRTVEEDMPEIDPVAGARQAHLPLFDYAPLMAMASRRSAETAPIPSALLAENGKTVVLAGFCVRRTKDTPPHILVGKSWWDGVAQGPPPTIYNSVVVLPADKQQVPPLWKPSQVFTGVLAITADPARWRQDGVVQLRNAQIGIPGVTRVRVTHTGPILPWEAEGVLLGIVLFRSVGVRSQRAKPVQP
ncbi:MAG: hypothetical protein JWL77_4974, partial [Chthonomonadaceae bacterium]|nr:hypothetical protein [Chthonomonadaceae bacterium]